MSDQSRGSNRWDLPDRPRSRNYRYLRRTWEFMRPYRGRLAVAAVALTITASATLGVGVGLKFLVDKGLRADNTHLLDVAFGILIAITMVIAGGTATRFFLVTWVGERVVADLRAAVFSHILRLSPGFYETAKTGEILSRLTTDTTLLQTVIGSSLSLAVRNSFTLVGGVILLIVTNPYLTGIVALVVPVVVAPIILYGRRVRKLSRDSQDRIAGVSAYGEEALNAIRTVQAFVHEDRDRALFNSEVERAFKTAIDRTIARAMLLGIVFFLVFGAVAVVLWVGGRGVIHGDISGGDLTAFLYYAVLTAGAVGAISEVFGDLQRAAGATERLVELLETPPDISAPANPLPMPTPARGAVTFDNVTFHYPSRPEVAALRGLNLTVTPGEHVALVGPSGAGKTTVFQLLLRFYDPQSGAVSIDGADLRKVDPRVARARVGLVSQDPVIFASSAMENIRYGRPDATDDEVRAAAEAAAATEFINRLPEGMNSFLGEKGVRLSGGQRQRIAIARAILRDPALLLLDEATSALDAENERLVQRALERLMVGRTTMVIAHRLATVVDADRIVVIDNGRLIDTGRHQDLLISNPLYGRLAALQFSADSGIGGPAPDAGIAAQ